MKVIKEFYTIEHIVKKGIKTPIDTAVIPNYMGINLCSVHSMEWERQEEDGQLTSLKINFTPAIDIVPAPTT